MIIYACEKYVHNGLPMELSYTYTHTHTHAHTVECQLLKLIRTEEVHLIKRA
jgi:hypothetical protein